MKLNLDGHPIDVGFNFSVSSSEIGVKVMKFLSEGKEFVLYSGHSNYKIYCPKEMSSIDSDKEIIKYLTPDQFNTALAFDIMCYDSVQEIKLDKQIDNTKLLTP